MRFVVSCSALAPTLAVIPSLAASKGLAVLILIDAPIPPVAILALPVL